MSEEEKLKGVMVEEKPILYCVIAEYFRGLRCVAIEKVYTHATTDNQAKATFYATAKKRAGCMVRILAAAPVVGFFGDENGQNLSVES